MDEGLDVLEQIDAKGQEGTVGGLLGAVRRGGSAGTAGKWWSSQGRGVAGDTLGAVAGLSHQGASAPGGKVH